MALEDKIEKNPAEGSLDENAAQQQAEQTPQAGGEAADLQKKKRRRRKKTAAARRASAAAAEAAENQEKEDGDAPAADAPAAEARPDAEPDAESAPAPEAPKTPEPQAEEPAALQEAPAGEAADQPEEPAAEAPGGEQPAEEQPAEEQPAEDQSAEDQPAETQAAEESAAESAEEPAGAAAEQKQTPPAPEEPAEPEPTPEQLRRNAELTRTVQISIEKLMEMQAAQTPPAEPEPAEPEPAPPTLEDHIRSGLGRMARWLLLVAAFVAVVAGLGIAMLYSAATPEKLQKADCLIVDGYGLLSSIYRYGTVAYVGGGFGAGIHNVPEAAVYGIPVVIGPNNDKFREARDLLANGGCREVQDAASFRHVLDTFLSRPGELAAAGKAAGDYIRNNAGAVDKVFRQVAWPV